MTKRRARVWLMALLVGPWTAADEPAPVVSEVPPAGCVSLLRAARLALDSGGTATGLRLLREAAEAWPDELVPLIELSGYERLHGLPESESAALRELLSRRLADPVRGLTPGVVKYLVESVDASDAELELTLAALRGRLERAPRDAELLEGRALVEERLGRTAEARRTLGSLLEVEPSDEVRWRCAQLDMRLERWSDAADTLAPLVEREEPATWARVPHVRALARAGRYDGLLRRLELLGPERRILRDTIDGILLDAAWTQRDLGRDAEAESLFRRVLRADPDNLEARAAVLYLYSGEDERRAHEARLEKGRRRETDPDRLLEEGATLLAAGQNATAFDMLVRASAALLENEIVWYNLGVAAMRLERWEEALDALNRAAALEPRRAESHLNAGVALYRLGRPAEAIVALRRALEAEPEMRQAHYYLSQCHRALGDDEAAAREQRLYGGGS